MNFLSIQKYGLLVLILNIKCIPNNNKQLFINKFFEACLSESNEPSRIDEISINKNESYIIHQLKTYSSDMINSDFMLFLYDLSKIKSNSSFNRIYKQRKFMNTLKNGWHKLLLANYSDVPEDLWDVNRGVDYVFVLSKVIYCAFIRLQASKNDIDLLKYNIHMANLILYYAETDLNPKTFSVFHTIIKFFIFNLEDDYNMKIYVQLLNRYIDMFTSPQLKKYPDSYYLDSDLETSGLPIAVSELLNLLKSLQSKFNPNTTTYVDKPGEFPRYLLKYSNDTTYLTKFHSRMLIDLFFVYEKRMEYVSIFLMAGIIDYISHYPEYEQTVKDFIERLFLMINNLYKLDIDPRFHSIHLSIDESRFIFLLNNMYYLLFYFPKLFNDVMSLIVNIYSNDFGDIRKVAPSYTKFLKEMRSEEELEALIGREVLNEIFQANVRKLCSSWKS